MILTKIADKTRERVNELKVATPLSEIRERAENMQKAEFLFENALKSPELSFICEVKKASPSKGVISAEFPYIKTAREYGAAGAAAISVLTEPYWFLGADNYLTEIAETVNVPILRKDFTVDEYQIYEAKIIGASAILLICALLPAEIIRKYIKIADSLGLSCLVEAHDENEVVSAVNAGARVVGVNNRNLKTFEVDMQTCVRLRKLVPENILFVAESGIKTREDILALGEGIDAVLIGETLMKSADKKLEIDKLRGII